MLPSTAKPTQEMDAQGSVGAGSQAVGRVITFYSYKGGTGRSMALANVAWILASNGRKVLVIDWDLEAPGLHRYFAPFLLDAELARTEGLIEFVRNFEDETLTIPLEGSSDSAKSVDDEPHPISAEVLADLADIRRYAVALDYHFPKQGRLELVPAGRQDAGYSSRVTTLDWDNLYQRLGGGAFFDEARRQMLAEYDYVLIDSRTGISDTAGICTIQLPDTLVVCFTANNQSITGAAAVTESVAQYWLSQPEGRKRELRIFPLFTRVESAEKDKLRRRKILARNEFNGFLSHIPEGEREIYWGGVQVPYDPFYAYEELLATFGDTPHEQGSVLAAMERLAEYLTDGDPRGKITELIPPTQEERKAAAAKYAESKKLPNVTDTEPQTVASTSAPRFDAYLLYNSEENALVLELATRLKSAGVRLWLDVWNLAPGDLWRSKIDEAIDQSSSCVVCIGERKLGNWQEQEVPRLIQRRSKEPRDSYRVIPVLLPGVSLDDVPESLREFQCVDLRSSVTTGPGVSDLVNLLLGNTPRPGQDQSESPYPGLEPFTENRSSYFFGRESQVQQILNWIKDRREQPKSRTLLQSRAMFVTGPRGCGKTSLVRAGVLGALAAGKLEGSSRWPTLVVRPGADPLGNLAVALAALPEFSSNLSQSRELVEAMRNDKSGLQLALRLAFGNSSEFRARVFVIDQFEEVFDQCQVASARQAFLDNLSAAIRDSDDNILWIISLREDTVRRIPVESGWSELVERNRLRLSVPTEPELRKMIVEPGRMFAVDVDAELVERLVDDYRDGRLDLSLCQAALRATWDHRGRQGMSLATYLSTGGTDAVVGENIESAYQSLSLSDQLLARALLLRCFCTANGNSPIPRESVPIAEFATKRWSMEEIVPVLQRLADARIIVVLHNGVGEMESVRIHAPLFKSWDRMNSWLRERPEDIRLRHLVTTAAAARKRIGASLPTDAVQKALRSPSLYLYMYGFRSTSGVAWILSGDDLFRIDAWVETREGWLNDFELECLETSKRLARTRRTLGWYFVTFLVAVSSIGAYVFVFRQDETQGLKQKIDVLEQDLAGLRIANSNIKEVQQELNVAKANRRSVQGLLLAAHAAAEMPRDRPLGLLLALEAARLAPDGKSAWSVEKLLRETLSDAVVSPLVSEADMNVKAPLARSGPLFVFDRRGRWVAATGHSVSAGLSDLSTAQPWAKSVELRGPPDAVTPGDRDQGPFAIAVSPSDRIAVVLYETPSNPSLGQLYQWRISEAAVAEYDRLTTLVLPRPAATVREVRVSEKGRWLFMLNQEAGRSDEIQSEEVRSAISSMYVWNLEDLTPGKQHEHAVNEEGVVVARLSRDERWLAAGRSDGAVLLWNLNARGPSVPLRYHKEAVIDALFSKDGRWLYTASVDRSVVAWDLAAETTVSQLPQWRVVTRHKEPVITLDESDDGDLLLTGSSDGELRVHSTKSAVDSGGTAPATVMHPEGRLFSAGITLTHPFPRLVSVGRDGRIAFWNLFPGAPDRAVMPLLHGADSGIQAIALGGNQRWLVVAGNGVQLVPLRFDDLLQLARKDLGDRKLTKAERQKFDVPD